MFHFLKKFFYDYEFKYLNDLAVKKHFEQIAEQNKKELIRIQEQNENEKELIRIQEDTK